MKKVYYIITIMALFPSIFNAGDGDLRIVKSAPSSPRTPEHPRTPDLELSPRTGRLANAMIQDAIREGNRHGRRARSSSDVSPLRTSAAEALVTRTAREALAQSGIASERVRKLQSRLRVLKVIRRGIEGKQPESETRSLEVSAADALRRNRGILQAIGARQDANAATDQRMRTALSVGAGAAVTVPAVSIATALASRSGGPSSLLSSRSDITSVDGFLSGFSTPVKAGIGVGVSLATLGLLTYIGFKIKGALHSLYDEFTEKSNRDLALFKRHIEERCATAEKALLEQNKILDPIIKEQMDIVQELEEIQAAQRDVQAILERQEQNFTTLRANFLEAIGDQPKGKAHKKKKKVGLVQSLTLCRPEYTLPYYYGEFF